MSHVKERFQIRSSCIIIYFPRNPKKIQTAKHSKNEQNISQVFSLKTFNFSPLLRLSTSIRCFHYNSNKMVEKDWKQSSLAVDIHEVLREKETRLPNFMAASPQLKVRRFLVDWLAIICEKIGSSHGVLHLAVCYMDFFMDKFIIQESQLHLLALSCMLLAGNKKFILVTSNLHLKSILSHLSLLNHTAR